MFHFLTEPADRDASRDLAASTVTPAGFLIVARFALDGPARCSGLPVTRYGPAELAAAFTPHFTPHLVDDEMHHTPWSAEQHFTWLVLQRARQPPSRDRLRLARARGYQSSAMCI